MNEIKQRKKSEPTLADVPREREFTYLERLQRARLFAESIAADTNSPIAKRLAALDRVFIAHDAVKEAMFIISETVDIASIKVSPKCVLLTGSEGVGKTWVVEHFLAMYPNLRSDEKTSKPVVLIRVPESASIKDLSISLLEELGDQYPSSGTVGAMKGRINKQAQGVGLRLLILDEFQHLVERTTKTSRVALNAANWIKNLHSSLRIPILMVGILRAKEVLDVDGQLRRRTTQVVMDCIAWHPGEISNPFLRVLAQIEKAFKFEAPMQLTNLTLAKRLYIASVGNMCTLMTLIKEAYTESLIDGASKIDSIHWKHVFQKHFAASLSSTHKVNPFEVPEANLDDVLASVARNFQHMAHLRCPFCNIPRL